MSKLVVDSYELKTQLKECIENLDKQKKELTQLKTKLTKLSKKTSEEDK